MKTLWIWKQPYSVKLTYIILHSAKPIFESQQKLKTLTREAFISGLLYISTAWRCCPFLCPSVCICIWELGQDSVNIWLSPVGCSPPVESHDRWKGSVWLKHFHLWLYQQLSSQNSLHSTALYVQASSVCLRRHHVSRPHNTGCGLIVAAYQQAYHCPKDKASLSVLGRLTMHLTQLNRECLLHLFSFLDKDSRRSLSLTCCQLRSVFLDPCLWNLLHFSSPCQLRRDNFVLGPSLRYLTICWYSSRVLQVCNIEDWLKSSFQKDICSKHEGLVSTFLAHVCHMWVFVCNSPLLCHEFWNDFLLLLVSDEIDQQKMDRTTLAPHNIL